MKGIDVKDGFIGLGGEDDAAEGSVCLDDGCGIWKSGRLVEGREIGAGLDVEEMDCAETEGDRGGGGGTAKQLTHWEMIKIEARRKKVT